MRKVSDATLVKADVAGKAIANTTVMTSPGGYGIGFDTTENRKNHMLV
jgi:hypothetical protein